MLVDGPLRPSLRVAKRHEIAIYQLTMRIRYSIIRFHQRRLETICMGNRLMVYPARTERKGVGIWDHPRALHAVCAILAPCQAQASTHPLLVDTGHPLLATLNITLPTHGNPVLPLLDCCSSMLCSPRPGLEVNIVSAQPCSTLRPASSRRGRTTPLAEHGGLPCR